MTTTEDLAAKLATMTLEARVRATANITYSPSGLEIAYGTRGTIRGVSHGGALVAVQWDGLEKSIWTSYDGMEALLS